MSELIRRHKDTVALIMLLVGGTQAFLLLPYRVAQAEVKLEAVSSSHHKDHDANTRIEAELIGIREQVTYIRDRIDKRP